MNTTFNNEVYKRGLYELQKGGESFIKTNAEIKKIPSIVTIEKTQKAISIVLDSQEKDKYIGILDTYKKVRNVATSRKSIKKPLILQNEFITLLTNIDLLVQFSFLKIIRKLESRHSRESGENIKRLLENVHFYTNLLVEIIQLFDKLDITNYPFNEIQEVKKNGYGISKNAPEGLISVISKKYTLPHITHEDRSKRLESQATKRAREELKEQFIENYRKNIG